MQLRGLLVAAIALVLVSGGLWYSNKVEREKEGKPEAGAPPQVVAISAGDVKQVDIQRPGETISLDRDQSGKWQITAPQPMGADQDAATSVANTFANLNAEHVVDEKPADLSKFGLASPALTVSVTKKDGKTTKLLLGDDTPTGGSVFAKLGSEPRVFTLASYNKASVDKTVKDLEDKRLLTFDTDKLTRLELTLKGQTVEFGKNNQNEWQIVRPTPARADGGAVESVITKLQDAKKDPQLSDEEQKKLASSFASAAPVATAKVTDAAGTQELQVRKDKDNNYYAKSSVVPGAHKIGADVGEALNKSVTDFRNKKLFDFGFSDPTKIEIFNDNKTRTFTKQDTKWMEGSTELDTTATQNLVDKLRDLTATGFPDSGFDNVVFDATVTSNSGKRVEKVLISKSGDRYIAKRDNEPALYELDKSTVEDLEHTAADVKPAPPPAKSKTK